MYFAEQKCQNVETHLDFQNRRIYETHGHLNVASASLIQQMFIVYIYAMTCTVIVIQLYNLKKDPVFCPLIYWLSFYSFKSSLSPLQIDLCFSFNELNELIPNALYYLLPLIVYLPGVSSLLLLLVTLTSCYTPKLG